VRSAVLAKENEKASRNYLSGEVAAGLRLKLFAALSSSILQHLCARISVPLAARLFPKKKRPVKAK
jgi:hypothetical protein